jgi:hypothetical protein
MDILIEIVTPDEILKHFKCYQSNIDIGLIFLN